MNDCIILTGGGTAGHVMVNINLESELKKHFKTIVYLGSKSGIEKDLVCKLTSYKYVEIPSVKFDRSKPLKVFAIPFKLKKAVSAAQKELQFFNPCVVFSKGGYVGLPVVIAASKLKIPAICHESDLSLGLANKIAKRYVSAICTNFKKTAETGGKKCIHTSMPLKISTLSKAAARAKLAISTTLPVLLVTGGSLGARALNNFIFENIDALTKKYYVVHLVGRGNLRSDLLGRNGYQQIEFSSDMWTIFKAADYALSRAGANTIVELLANEILTIFVPLPKSVSRGDQIENANEFCRQGASKTINQSELTLERVTQTFEEMAKNSKEIKAAIRAQKICDGTKNIMAEILKQAKSQR